MKQKPVSVKVGILLINLGTPEAPTRKAVRNYLKEFLSDSRVISLPKWLWLPILYGIILPWRSSKSLRLYQSIWMKEGSPLLVNSLKLQEKLSKLVLSASIEVGMCYGSPTIEAGLDRLLAHSLDHMILLPLYPQYASATTGAVWDKIVHYFSKRIYIPSFSWISHYATHPLYLQALADSLIEHWKTHEPGEKLLISFHGLPQKVIEKGDPYAASCQQTASLLAERLKLRPDQWELVFQSRFGRAAWLEPDCETRLIQLAQAGIKHVDVICPGFSVDCLETLEEIAERYQKSFRIEGGETLSYCPALNSSEGHLKLLMELIQSQCPK